MLLYKKCMFQSTRGTIAGLVVRASKRLNKASSWLLRAAGGSNKTGCKQDSVDNCTP